MQCRTRLFYAGLVCLLRKVLMRRRAEAGHDIKGSWCARQGGSPLLKRIANNLKSLHMVAGREARPSWNPAAAYGVTHQKWVGFGRGYSVPRREI